MHGVLRCLGKVGWDGVGWIGWGRLSNRAGQVQVHATATIGEAARQPGASAQQQNAN